MSRLLSRATLVALTLTASTNVLLAGVAEDTLNVAISRETDFVDPIHGSNVDGDMFAAIIYDTLIYADRATGELLPSLAEAWEWLDSTTIEIRLREGLKFHNGETLNVDDVAYTVGLVMDMENGFRQQRQDFGNIAGIDRIDDLTFRLRLNNPQPTFENTLASRFVIWPDEYTAEHGHMIHATKPVGTGPYMMADMTAGSNYNLKANPDYFAGAREPAQIGNINIRVIPEVQTQIAELMAGQVDLALGIQASNAQMLDGQPGIRIQYGPSTRLYFLSMDVVEGDSNPLADLRVREAISHAINRPELVGSLVSPEAQVLTTQCSPAQNFCPDGIEPIRNFDPEAARALLAEAGYANGLNLNLMAEASLRPVGEAIQAYLRPVGINISLETLPLTSWRESFISGKSQMSLLGWGGGISSVDVSYSLGIFFNGSATDYVKDPDLTAWTADAQSSVDPKHRSELYQQVFSRINEQAYVVPLYAPVVAYITSETVDFPTPFLDFVDLSLAKWADSN